MIIAVDVGDVRQADDVLSGVYEKVRPLKAGDRVLDLGAHVGYFTMLAAKKVGPKGFVVAFEPNRRNFDRLQVNCHSLHNALGLWAGALDQNGSMPMFEAAQNSGAHSFHQIEDATQGKPVPVVDIGEWLIGVGFKPDFIKIDAEYSELAILQSLAKAKVKSNLVVEIHSQALWADCCKVLKAVGYEVSPTDYGNPPHHIFYATPK